METTAQHPQGSLRKYRLRAAFWISLLCMLVSVGACRENVSAMSPTQPPVHPPQVISTPHSAAPTLLASYAVVKGDMPHFEEIVYRPRSFGAPPYEGWDALELPSGSFRTYLEDEWLTLELHRDATLAVLWEGSDPPSWLASWREEPFQVDGKPVFSKTFRAGEAVLGAIGGTDNQGYTVLLAEADGNPSAAPPVPEGLETPAPNEYCPEWVHNLYVAQGPDGQVYPTWHPQIDPVYWCYFGHEHGSDPSLLPVSFAPTYGYEAAKVPQNETPHEGFKNFIYEDYDGNWHFEMVHGGTADHRRICAPFHTVNNIVWDAQGDLLLALRYKANFGPSKHNGGDSNPVIRPSVSENCPDQEVLDDVAVSGHAEKKLRVAKGADHEDNTGYETWREDSAAPLLADFFALRGKTFDFFGPMTGCTRIDCEEGDLYWTGSKGEGRILTFLPWYGFDASKAPATGYFYTDPYFEKLLPEGDPHAVQQFVAPGAEFKIHKPDAGNNAVISQDAWRMLYTLYPIYEPGTAPKTPSMNLEASLRAPN